MAKKKKKTKAQKRDERLRKAKQWVLTYEGSHVVRDYSKRFKVDIVCASKDLSAINGITPEQRSKLKEEHKIRLQQKNEEREARLLLELEKQETGQTQSTAADSKPKPKTANANTKTGKRPKRRCENCGRAMKQQFIGLKHCKCGTSWSKDGGYFERTSDMVFALQREVTKKGKNSIRTKQVPVIRYSATQNEG